MGKGYGEIAVSDIPEATADRAEVAGRTIDLVRQRTGYGYKRLFLCPSCGQRRAKLLLYNGSIVCRGCIPFDIYQYRRGLYDEGGTDLIVWHMQRAARRAGIRLAFPFHYVHYIGQYMHLTPKKSRALYAQLKRLQMLENMRFCAIMFDAKFTSADIKRYTAPEFTDGLTLWHLKEFCIFTGARPHENKAKIAAKPCTLFE